MPLEGKVCRTHVPLQALGEAEVRRRSAQEDKPLRMIKTLLHELCKLRKERIFDDARAMPGEGMGRLAQSLARLPIPEEWLA